MGEQRGRREGAAGSGGVRTTLREDRGRNQVCAYGIELAGDTAGRSVVVQCVYGVCEGNMEDPSGYRKPCPGRKDVRSCRDKELDGDEGEGSGGSRDL